MAEERPDWNWYQRASEEVSAGRLEHAEDAIESALQAGHLWRVSLLASPVLEPLQGRARYEAAAAEARRRAEKRNLRPLVLTAMLPNPRPIVPLLLVLHGARGNAAQELERWRPATDLGWMVAAGQSSQPATADGFCWDPPLERVMQDLRAIATMLPVHGRVVLAGFSQGAWIALVAALQAEVIAAGTVAMVGPFAGPDPFTAQAIDTTSRSSASQ